MPVVDEDQQYVGIISKGMLLRALDREGEIMADQNNPWDTTPAADNCRAIRRRTGYTGDCTD